MWRKAFAAYNAGDVNGARVIQGAISKLRAEGSGSLVHASTTSNYTPQGHKALANALGFDVGPCRLPLPLVSAEAASRAAKHVLAVMDEHDARPDFSMLKTTAASFDWSDIDQHVIPPGGGLTKPLVLLRAAGGYVMCGLLNIETCEKLDEVAAVVRGVNTPEDVLEAKLEAVSPAAEARCEPHHGSTSFHRFPRKR
jgi:hypothetical protein